MARSALAAAALAGAVVPAVAAVPYALPPMGFNAWFALQVHANETSLLDNARALVALGLRDAGYVYFNIDGGWEGGRNSSGWIYPNTTRFPNGLEPVADGVHALGLKFGMYTDKGPGTCDGLVGSYPHYDQDAAYYAHLKADYVKVDSCGGTQDHDGALALYSQFQDALVGAYATAGLPPLYYSMCGWYAWYPSRAFPVGVGNSWRIGPDALSWQNVLINWDTAANTWGFTGPGAFNDVDEIGPQMSRPQQVTQMNMIAVIGSPLLLSFDLRNLTAPQVADFANPEVIAVHQDPHPRGPVYRRLVGGPLAGRLISPTTHNTCDPANPLVVWKRLSSPVVPGAYFLYPSTNPSWSLHANHAWDSEYCSHAEQAWLAPADNKTCCDAACSNQLLVFNDTDATVTNLWWKPADNYPGPYLTVDPTPNTLFFNERYNATDPRWAAQRFAFDGVTGLLMSLADNSCVGVPAALPDTTNVWGRALADGSVALVFVNNAPAQGVVTCDAACFAAIGVAPSTDLHVRDIRARADVGTITASQGYAATVPGGGASAMLRFTPQS